MTKIKNVNKKIMSYTKYIAILNQSGESNPSVTVLENTIGTIVWARDSVGFYYGTLIGAFPSNKTVIFFNDVQDSGKSIATVADDDTIQIFCVGSNGIATDNFLAGNSIEIRVYQ